MANAAALFGGGKKSSKGAQKSAPAAALFGGGKKSSKSQTDAAWEPYLTKSSSKKAPPNLFGKGAGKNPPKVAVLFGGTPTSRASDDYSKWLSRANQSKSPVTGAPYSYNPRALLDRKSGDQPLGRGIKKVGGFILDTMSVPGAATQTAMQHLWMGRTGVDASGKRVDKTISWKNALGNFHRGADGRTGTDIATSALTGTKNPWVNLAVQLVVDPLNLVGVGTVPTKIAKGAEAARKVKAVEDAAEVARGAATVGGRGVQLTKAHKQILAHGILGKEVPLTAAAKKQRLTHGILGKGATSKGKWAAPGAGKTVKDAEKPWVGLLAKTGITPKTVPLSSKDAMLINQDGLPLRFNEAIRNVNKHHTAHNVKVRDVAVTIGGDKGVKIRIPGLKVNKRGLAPPRSMDPLTGYLRLSPIDKTAHAIKRAGNDTLTSVPRSVITMARRHGLTTMDELGVTRGNKTAGTMLQMVAETRHQAGDRAAQRLITILEKRGLWTPGHTKMLDEVSDFNAAIRPQDYQGDLDKIYFDLLQDAEEAKHLTGKGAQKARMAADTAVYEFEQNLIGNYVTRGNDHAQAMAKLADKREAIEAGLAAHPDMYRHQLDAEYILNQSAKHPSSFARVTKPEMVKHLRDLGIEKEHANEIVGFVDQALQAAKRTTFKAKRKVKLEKGTGDVKQPIMPEWDFMTNFTQRVRVHIMRQVDAELMELSKLAAQSGAGKVEKIFDDLTRVPSGSGRKTLWQRYATDWVPNLKAFFTVVNVPHYTNNLTGDALNAGVNGNLLHLLLPFSSVAGSRADRLAKTGLRIGKDADGWAVKMTDKDFAALTKEWKVGNRTMTGLEVDMATRLVGLGRGYHASDIKSSAKLLSAPTKNPLRWWGRKGVDLNARRDAAQRISTYIKHVQNGDDPFTAARKTIRVHFDYSELTDFERNVLRNVFLFYVWFKKNPLLQMSSIATRPGWQAAFMKMNNTREHYLNEPDYYGEQGAFSVPGIGNIRIPGDPRTGIFQWDVTGDALRRNIIGATPPPIKMAIEGPMNRNAFTGAPIQRSEGELKPHALAGLLQRAGVPSIDGVIGRTRTNGGRGPVKSGLNPWITWAIGSFQGPAAGQFQSAYTESGGSDTPTWMDYLARAVGAPQRQRDNPGLFNALDAINRRKQSEDYRRKMRSQGGLN